MAVIFPFLFLVCYNKIGKGLTFATSYFPFYSWYVIIVLSPFVD